MSVLDPISVILVTAGSRGEALLFRYPFSDDKDEELDEKDNENCVSNDKQVDNKPRLSVLVKKGCLNYSDKTLANILTPGEKLCGKKFELRIGDVLFVGHPTLVQTNDMQYKRNENQNKVDDGITIKLFNIVFALQADVEPSVCTCYHNLSQKIAIALKHEEIRCNYFSNERQAMLAMHDEVSELPEANEVSPFHLILPKSTLAKDLCDAFDSVCETGIVSLRINSWVGVSFCLPHKVHNITSEMMVKPEAVEACLSAMRPYHTVLLLVDETSLSSLLPKDCSPDLLRFVKLATPLKSFQTLSQDTDIPLSLIFSIAAHLVYWGKARIIYPLCESNVYVVSPVASIRMNSPMAEQFAQEYPGMSLHDHLAQFSLPTPLGEHANPLWLPHQKTEQVQRVIWMLKHQLLIQLHMYIYLVPQSYSAQENSTLFYLQDKGDITDETKTLQQPTDNPEELPTSQSPDFEKTAELSEEEMLNILQHCGSVCEPEDIKLFTRVCHYFHGNHHFEEIMYYENLRRNQLLTLLEKFREMLFICQHEDPATVYHTMNT